MKEENVVFSQHKGIPTAHVVSQKQAFESKGNLMMNYEQQV
jgi:hypothetical protein